MVLWVLADPPQGQVLLVLSMDNTCPTSSFDMDLCAQKLQALGLQVSSPGREFQLDLHDLHLNPRPRWLWGFFGLRVDVSVQLQSISRGLEVNWDELA